MEKDMKNIFRLALVFLLALSISGCNRTLVVHNVEAQVINHSVTANQVEKAILKAGIEKGWSMTVRQPGIIDAYILVREKHRAVIQIDYDEKEYSIMYKDSENLLYEDGKIHRNYNKWIILLDQKIQANLIDASS